MDAQRRHHYLQAMGIQAWERRDLPQAQTVESVAGVVEPVVEKIVSAPVPVPAPVQVPTAPPVPTPNLEKQQHVGQDTSSGDEARLTWQQLQTRVAVCEKCDLHTSRTHTVFGVGSHDADWLIIGEAPGVDEDRQGEPFVGRAGQLLNAMIEALGMKRENVYIANILKCRPPDNRDPRPEEVVQCEPYLKRQITLLQPRIILAVGRIAAQNLLKSDEKIGKLRGKQYTYADTGIPLVATYHPAYLLRSPKEKRKAWEDLKFAYSLVNKEP